jgi:hypothetical protein
LEPTISKTTEAHMSDNAKEPPTNSKTQNQPQNPPTFRHWKATMEYHRTKDILYVMRMLGHKNIKNTLIYTQLLPFKEDDQFICKVATNVKEACELIQDGFNYVTGEYSDGGKIFKKIK